MINDNISFISNVLVCKLMEIRNGQKMVYKVFYIVFIVVSIYKFA